MLLLCSQVTSNTTRTLFASMQNVMLLFQFIDARGQILGQKQTRLCPKHQRKVCHLIELVALSLVSSSMKPDCFLLLSLVTSFIDSACNYHITEDWLAVTHIATTPDATLYRGLG